MASKAKGKPIARPGSQPEYDPQPAKITRPTSIMRPGSQPVAAVEDDGDDDEEYDFPSAARTAARTTAVRINTPGSSYALSSAAADEEEEEEDDSYDVRPSSHTSAASSSSATAAGSRKRQRGEPNTFEATYQNDDEEDDDGAHEGEHHGDDNDDGEIQGAAAGGRRVSRRTDSSSAASAASSSELIALPSGGGSQGAAPVALRPIAFTKHGMRQFVETKNGLRMFLQNCVCTVDLKCTPNLETIATRARNAEYNPQRFAAVIMRLREPKATGLLFTSGKLVVTGTKNEDDGRLGARKIAKIVSKLGFACSFANFKVQNMVVTGDCGFPIRLEGLADDHHQFSSYEPELFPGLIYRMEQPKVVCLVFVSGKVVLTGAKNRSSIIEGMEKIYPILYKYKKTPRVAAVIGPTSETGTYAAVNTYAPSLLLAQPSSDIAAAGGGAGGGGGYEGAGEGYMQQQQMQQQLPMGHSFYDPDVDMQFEGDGQGGADL